MGKDGRSKVMEDPKGQYFPWKAKPFAEIIGETSLKGTSTVGKEAIAGKTLGIYFSAHWCPPCRGFTPQLAKVYKALKAQGKKFEIVFVSSDRDEAGFTGYFAEQPWLAVPFSARNVKKNLCDTFGIRGIPTLLLFDGKGNLVRSDGR